MSEDPEGGLPLVVPLVSMEQALALDEAARRDARYLAAVAHVRVEEEHAGRGDRVPAVRDVAAWTAWARAHEPELHPRVVEGLLSPWRAVIGDVAADPSGPTLQEPAGGPLPGRAWGRTGRVSVVPSPDVPGAVRLLVDGAVVASAARAGDSSPCVDGWEACTATGHRRCCASLDAAVLFALQVDARQVWRAEAVVDGGSS